MTPLMINAQTETSQGSSSPPGGATRSGLLRKGLGSRGFGPSAAGLHVTGTRSTCAPSLRSALERCLDLEGALGFILRLQVGGEEQREPFFFLLVVFSRCFSTRLPGTRKSPCVSEMQSAYFKVLYSSFYFREQMKMKHW